MIEVQSQRLAEAANEAMRMGLEAEDGLAIEEMSARQVIDLFNDNGYEDVGDYWSGNFVAEGLELSGDEPEVHDDPLMPGDEVTVKCDHTGEKYDLYFHEVMSRNAFGEAKEIMGVNIVDGVRYVAALASLSYGPGFVLKAKFVAVI